MVSLASTVDLTPLYGTINQTIVLILSGLVVWIGMQFRAWLAAHAQFLGQATDKTLADGFDRALQNGVNIAMQQLDQYEGANTKVAVNGWLTARAAQYAIDHSPDYMKRFGLSPEDIAFKALAKLPPPPQIATDTTGTTVPKTTPVDIRPLNPPAA